MDRYERLTKILIEAKAVATAINIGREDGGTCNFDSLALPLVRWQETKVIKAIESAGLSGHKTLYHGCARYHIIPPGGWRGSNRTKAAETMRDYMVKNEYEASVFYMMD